MGLNWPVGAIILTLMPKLESKDYCHERWPILNGNGLTAFSISSHLVGQAICDRIDERHKAILPPEIWGDGDREGVAVQLSK